MPQMDQQYLSYSFPAKYNLVTIIFFIFHSPKLCQKLRTERQNKTNLNPSLDGTYGQFTKKIILISKIRSLWAQEKMFLWLCSKNKKKCIIESHGSVQSIYIYFTIHRGVTHNRGISLSSNYAVFYRIQHDLQPQLIIYIAMN